MDINWIEGAAWPHLLSASSPETPMYRWVRWGGYEVSTVGDRRFSAMCAYLPDGRTIEAHYQCDVKGYDPGGSNWRLGKGKPPRDEGVDLWAGYLGLWVRWAQLNPDRVEILREAADRHDGLLSDRFASTPINQAHAWAVILSRLSSGQGQRGPVRTSAAAGSLAPASKRTQAPSARRDEGLHLPQASLF